MTGFPGKRPVSKKEQRLWEAVTDNVRPLSENREPENKESGAGKPDRRKDTSEQEDFQPDPDPDWCPLPILSTHSLPLLLQLKIFSPKKPDVFLFQYFARLVKM